MKFKTLILIIGTILFNFLFWHEQAGINVLIFTLFITGIGIRFFPNNLKSFNTALVLSGSIISALTVVYHASDLAVIVWIASIVLLQSFLHQEKLKTVFFGYAASVSSFVMSWQLAEQYIKLKNKSRIHYKSVFKFLKLTLLPILTVYIFYWIFKFANPVFDELSDTFFINLLDRLNNIFKNVSVLQILFTIWGFIVIAWFLYKNNKDYVVYNEQNYSETIIRKRKKQSQTNNFWFGKTGLKPLLKNEFSMGLIMIGLINILLLIINIIDISSIWINFEYTPEIDLKQFVHEGTYLLILSILLSIGIMIWFFRKNLNFYRNKKKLQILSYLWIVQNIILLISVILRNMHYINYFGLAYKRIGVFFFLALVSFGLISLYLKIKKSKSSYWLFKINIWALYIGFVLFAIPDWDIIISKHNLAHPLRNNIETSFLLTFDDKALPYIDQRKDILFQSEEFNTYKIFYDTYQNVYKGRVKTFLTNYHKNTWLSWNYADSKAYKYYINNSKH